MNIATRAWHTLAAHSSQLKASIPPTQNTLRRARTMISATTNTLKYGNFMGRSIRDARQPTYRRSTAPKIEAKVGLFFATTSGFTQGVAEQIQEKFRSHGEISDPLDVEKESVSKMLEFDSVIVGAPTWNTGADENRSGTAWDEQLDALRGLDLTGMKAAVFGCGDSCGYGDYFCDAIEELHSVLMEAGAQMCGTTSTDGYDFTDSRSVVDGQFLGLPIDEVNEAELTDTRVEKWCAQLSSEGVA